MAPVPIAIRCTLTDVVFTSSIIIIGSFSNDYGAGNDNGKKAMG